MREGQAFTVVGVAVVFAVLVFWLADRERRHQEDELRIDPEAVSYLAREPLVTAGGAFALAFVGTSVVVIAANTTKVDVPASDDNR